jgi:GNAT superfamily N-acetyltransferase
MGETFAVKKEEEVKKDEPKKKFLQLLDEDQVEVKKLSKADSEDIVKVMRKCAFDVTEAEVNSITEYGSSFGAYVNRMLIGVGLSWPAVYDPDDRLVKGGEETNALYIEDPAVLLAYEGRGVRRILLKQREEEARASGKNFSIAYLYEDLPKGSIVDFIKESGSQLEKLYVSEEYEFFKTDKGVLAVKKL